MAEGHRKKNEEYRIALLTMGVSALNFFAKIFTNSLLLDNSIE